MLKIYVTNEKGIIEETNEIVKGCWIDLVNPEDNEVEKVAKLTHINEQMLKAALDEEETARCEIDDGNTIFVVDTPNIEESGDYFYSTLPIGIIYNHDYLVTVCLQESIILKEVKSRRIKSLSTAHPIMFLLTFLYKNAGRFLQYLKLLDKMSSKIQNELRRSMKNKFILQLLDLQKSLVYFSTSLTANEGVFEKIARIEQVNRMEEYKDLFEDILIENKQAVETCSVHRSILASTMEGFGSVINNNANIVMKVLTLVTIVLAIPTLFASFWGMNVAVPFESSIFGFWLVILISLVFTIVGTVLLLRATDGNSKKIKKKDKK